jgi:hypothetical protein
MTALYLIGSLRNREGVVDTAVALEEMLPPSVEVFCSWLAPGPEADDYWKTFEEGMGRTYLEALDGWAAKHVFEFDKFHLDRCDGAILTYPAGRSCHLEAGYMVGKGKPVWALLDDPERWDVMLRFLTGWHTDVDALGAAIRGHFKC